MDWSFMDRRVVSWADRPLGAWSLLGWVVAWVLLVALSVLLVVLMLHMLTLRAHATELAGAGAATDYAREAWELIKPAAAIIVLALAGTIATFLVQLLRRIAARVGVEIDEKQAARLHSAAENALKSAVTKYLGPVPNLVTDRIPDKIIQDAVSYMRSKNPEDTAGSSDRHLIDLVLSKAPQVQAVLAAGKSSAQPAVEVASAVSSQPGAPSA